MRRDRIDQQNMSSEWMKVMLEEISRKKAEAEQARIEDQTRAREQDRLEEQQRRDEPCTAPSSDPDRARQMPGV